MFVSRPLKKDMNICENEAKNDGSVSLSWYQNQTEQNIKKLRLGSTKEMADYHNVNFLWHMNKYLNKLSVLKLRFVITFCAKMQKCLQYLFQILYCLRESKDLLSNKLGAALACIIYSKKSKFVSI